MMFKIIASQKWFKPVVAFCLAALGLLSFAVVASAHHPFGGTTPDSFVAGLLSGFGHPVIGLDHLTFVVASGLIATGLSWGIIIPVGFVVATVGGTGIHLQEINLPIPEIVIAASVVVFGVLLALRNRKQRGILAYTLVLSAIAAIAGIFHGYAYGEAVVGAEMTPVAAYLLGFATIELAIAATAYTVGNLILKSFNRPFAVMRFIGLAISAVGIAFLGASVTG